MQSASKDMETHLSDWTSKEKSVQSEELIPDPSQIERNLIAVYRTNYEPNKIPSVWIKPISLIVYSW